MRKLVFGIALVVCLDVAFILMTAMEAEVPEMALAGVPHAAAPVIHEKPSLEPVAINDSEELDDRDPVWSARVDRLEPKLRSTSAAAKFRTSDTDEFRDPSVDAKRLFPDKLIYIGQYETYEISDPPNGVSPVNNPLETELETAENTRETSKKSFESRAFGVIKKPYKWIRSFASKLGR
ncbi:MAG TPA: hypothetical protein VMM38_09140 [Aridibacter sp.]|nr:hypothetical protein [Aridibacter sp.]